MHSEHKLLSYREAAEITGLSSASLRSMVSRNQFPSPIRLSVRKPRFLEQDISAWLDTKIAERGRQPEVAA